ncbi:MULTISPECIES: VOC family protein [Nocardiopsis]|uniref:VOC family protein n=1 Tax=Nocardiopsis TaxID=2013 RepID=UPI00064C205C|nr:MULTISPECIES: VOC family protein [Nocardiopsis]MCK9873555.1 VOC family protein [Nocardiopsis dassonvillei]WDZ92465.1 VOC family protein [Nocardiopsis sp. HUAS JQ3]
MIVLDLLATIGPRRREVPVPQLNGLARVTLSVRDRDESVRFYRTVLGFRVLGKRDHEGTRRTECQHPASGLLLALIQHRDNFKGRFDRRHCGLDRLTLGVENLGELEAWEERFAEMDVEHSPVMHGEEGSTLLFYDPDGTELALFAHAELDADED